MKSTITGADHLFPSHIWLIQISRIFHKLVERLSEMPIGILHDLRHKNLESIQFLCGELHSWSRGLLLHSKISTLMLATNPLRNFLDARSIQATYFCCPRSGLLRLHRERIEGPSLRCDWLTCEAVPIGLPVLPKTWQISRVV